MRETFSVGAETGVLAGTVSEGGGAAVSVGWATAVVVAVEVVSVGRTGAAGAQEAFISRMSAEKRKKINRLFIVSPPDLMQNSKIKALSDDDENVRDDSLGTVWIFQV